MFCTCHYIYSLSKSRSFWLEKSRNDCGNLDYFSSGEYPLTAKGQYLRALAHSGKFTYGSEEFASIYQVTLHVASKRDDFSVKRLVTKLIIYTIDDGFPMQQFIDELSLFGYFEEALTLAEIYKCKLNRLDCFKACGEQLKKKSLGHSRRDKDVSGIPLLRHWVKSKGLDSLSTLFNTMGIGEYTAVPKDQIKSVFDSVNGRLEDNIPSIIEKEIVNNDRICYWLSEVHSSSPIFYQLLFQYGFPANWDNPCYSSNTYHPFRKKHHTDIVGFRELLAYVPLIIRLRDLDIISIIYREARHLVFTIPYNPSHK